MTQTNRFVDMYRTDSLECVINQSIWMEARPSSPTSSCPPARFRAVDIGEFANSGGYLHHSFNQCNSPSS